MGLKPFIALLPGNTLPIPSLLLSGTGDMAGHTRIQLDITPLLDGAFRHASEAGFRLIVFVGYLAHAGQVAVIARALRKNAALIESVVVDPICGDNGRRYVAEELVAAWPALLELADWALPNVTEVRILSGEEAGSGIGRLKARFPRTRWIVTGDVSRESEITTYYHDVGSCQSFSHWRVPGHWNGTGDLFAAAWCRSFFFRKEPVAEAIGNAAWTVARSLTSRSSGQEQDIHRFLIQA